MILLVHETSHQKFCESEHLVVELVNQEMRAVVRTNQFAAVSRSEAMRLAPLSLAHRSLRVALVSAPLASRPLVTNPCAAVPLSEALALGAALPTSDLMVDEEDDGRGLVACPQDDDGL